MDMMLLKPLQYQDFFILRSPGEKLKEMDFM